MATISELNSYNLADAVKFHDELNPKLWKKDQLDPLVKKQLLIIAEDFVEELGISDLDVVDVTISGSNAAFSYTPHSDLDLHILVNMSELHNDEIYSELFRAKKTLYNDSHDITVHGIPVELYVQDANDPVVSLGEYSILHDKWIKIPKKKVAKIDQNATKAKYDQLTDLISLAIKTKDADRINKTLKLIRRYRQAGLDKGGEFSPENLAFKMIRTQGGISDLYAVRDKLHSEKLSIEEDNSILNKPTLTVDELARKHGVERMSIAKQLDKGIKVEMEHTNHRDIAREIALDHLAEDPKYYDKLTKLKLESTTSLTSLYMHEGVHYSGDMLLEQVLYEDFLGSAKQYLGAKFTQKMSDIKGQVNDFVNAGIIVKDILSNEQLMTNVTGQIRKWTSQLVKDVSKTIVTVGDNLGSPQLAQKLNTVWSFIMTKVREFDNSPGWKGFLGSLGIYGFVKFISEMVKNISTLKSTLASTALDALVGKVKELGTSVVGNITMPGFFAIFDKLTTVKQYFLDVLNQVKAKFGAISITGTPQFSKGVQLDEAPRTFQSQVTPLEKLIQDYGYFTSFGTVHLDKQATTSEGKQQLLSLVQRLQKDSKSFNGIDKQKMEANRDTILNHIYEMMQYAIPVLKKHLPADSWEAKRGQINSVLTAYNNARQINESYDYSAWGYWITTDGEIIPVGYLSHDLVAKRLGFNSKEDMVASGAIRITGSNISDVHSISKPSRKAVRSLAKLLKQVNRADKIWFADDTTGEFKGVTPRELLQRLSRTVNEASGYIPGETSHWKFAKPKKYDRALLYEALEEFFKKSGRYHQHRIHGIGSLVLNFNKLLEDNRTNWLDEVKEFWKTLQRLDGRTNIKLKTGISISVLQMYTHGYETDKVFEFRGHLVPKKIIEIDQDSENNIETIWFDDGSSFPDRSFIDRGQGGELDGIITMFFGDRAAAEHALTAARLSVPNGWKISTANLKENITEASGYIPSKKEKNDPRWCMALTVDVKPNSIKKNAKAFNWKTSRAGIPPQANPNGKITEDKRTVINSLVTEYVKNKTVTIGELVSNLAEATDDWQTALRLMEAIHVKYGDTFLIETTVNNQTKTSLQAMIDYYSSPSPKIGNQYIPVMFMLTGDRVVFFDVLSQTPVKESARFGTLETLTDQYVVLNFDGKLIKYPHEQATKLSFASVILIASVEKYNRLRTEVMMKYEQSLPPLASSVNESLMNEWKEFLGEDEQQGELFPGYDKEHKEKRLDNWLQSTHAWDGHKPRVFYHATTKDFDTFNTHGTGFASALGMAFEVERHGSFFAVDPKFAEEFIEDPNRPGQYKEGGSILPVYLSIQNPIDLRDNNLSYMLNNDETVQGFADSDIDLRSIYYHFNQFDRWELFDGPEGEDFVNNLQKLGFDGAIIVERVNGDAQSGEVWVAFNPNQVKSVYNRGSFSPDDPRLMRENG